MKPLVSVIMPVYNVAEYVEEAIDSIVGQNLKDWELIIVDDGSNDGSGNICKTYAKRDPRLTIIEQDNLGLPSARNNALKLAQGKYVYFFDSDDILSPSALLNCINLAEEQELDLVCFSGIAFTNLESVDISFLANLRKPSFLYPSSGEQLLAKLMAINAHSPAVWLYITSRELILTNNLSFEEGKIHEDIGFTESVFCAAKSAISLKDIYFRRRIRHNSIMSKPTTIHNVEGYIMAAKRVDDLITTHLFNSKSAKYFLSRYRGKLLLDAASKAHDIGQSKFFTTKIIDTFGYIRLIVIAPTSIFYVHLNRLFFKMRDIKRAMKKSLTKRTL